MALQTETTTAGSAESTNTQPGDNTSNNSNPFSLDPGTPPLIPAFLVTGMLLVVIVGVSTFRKIVRRRRMLRLGLVEGQNAWGPWGADLPGPHIGHGFGGRGGADRRFGAGGERRGIKVVDLGMKPRIWDVWARPEHVYEDDHYSSSKEMEARGEDSSDYKERNGWEGLLPLSVGFPKPPESSPNTTSGPRPPVIPPRTQPTSTRNRITDRIARYFRPPPPFPRRSESEHHLPIHNMAGPGLLPPSSMTSFVPPNLGRSPPTSTSIPSSSLNPRTDSLNVAVIIAMPFSSLSSSSSEKFGLHSDDNEDFEYMLGVSEVSLKRD